MSHIDLHFLYRNAHGVEKTHRVIKWSEDGRYIQGFSETDGAFRTFLKFRVVRYLDGSDGSLVDPHPTPPPKPSNAVPVDDRPQIVFTGFPAVQRADLERRADQAGMRVVKSVTQNLTLICGGPNAGPSKLAKARSQGVITLRQDEFLLLCETGEIPDAEEESC